MMIVQEPESWDRQTAIILAHGAGQGMDSPFMVYFHQEMARRGVLSVKFNFDYMANSRKVPDPQPKLRETYRVVIREVLDKYPPRRLFIGGKSMGGRVASYIAGEFPEVAGVVFLGYPLHPPGRTEQLRDEHLYALTRPMLFVSGTRDILAEQQLLQQVVDRMADRATMLWIEKGDHSLKAGRSDKTSLEYAAGKIEQWIHGIE